MRTPGLLKICRALLNATAGLASFAAALGLAGAPAADPPRVAVLVEEGLPPYGGTPALPPFKIVGVLAQHGILARALTAAELSDPAILNTQRVTVLILPYGNAFPKPAFANLRAFHAAGGCLVMNGVPFCHPCDKVDGRWKDLGHVNFFDHDAKGIGTGNFGGPAAKEKNPRTTLVPGQPLGLNTNSLPGYDAGLQWLDPHSFGPADEVIPLAKIEFGGEPYPAAALIRHRCAEFRGARDVWIGQVAPAWTN